jgi:hypothetical protein
MITDCVPNLWSLQMSAGAKPTRCDVKSKGKHHSNLTILTMDKE